MKCQWRFIYNQTFYPCLPMEHIWYKMIFPTCHQWLWSHDHIAMATRQAAVINGINKERQKQGRKLIFHIQDTRQQHKRVLKITTINWSTFSLSCLKSVTTQITLRSYFLACCNHECHKVVILLTVTHLRKIDSRQVAKFVSSWKGKLDYLLIPRKDGARNHIIYFHQIHRWEIVSQLDISVNLMEVQMESSKQKPIKFHISDEILIMLQHQGTN